jgi:midasin
VEFILKALNSLRTGEVFKAPINLKDIQRIETFSLLDDDSIASKSLVLLLENLYEFSNEIMFFIKDFPSEFAEEFITLLQEIRKEYVKIIESHRQYEMEPLLVSQKVISLTKLCLQTLKRFPPLENEPLASYILQKSLILEKNLEQGENSDTGVENHLGELLDLHLKKAQSYEVNSFNFDIFNEELELGLGHYQKIVDYFCSLYFDIFGVDKIAFQIKQFLSNSGTTEHFVNNYPKVKTYCFLLNKVFIIPYQNHFRSFSKFSYILINTFVILMQKGYCRPPEADETGEEKGDALEEGTGIAEGEGLEDVSEFIEEEGQVEGLKNEKKEEAENPIDEENGLEMENEFEGTLEDMDNKDDDQDVDDEMGSEADECVDAKNGNEKKGDEFQEDEFKDDGEAGGNNGESEMAAANEEDHKEESNQDNDAPNQDQEVYAESQSEDEIHEMNDEDNNAEFRNDENNEEEAETFPDDMNLDDGEKADGFDEETPEFDENDEERYSEQDESENIEENTEEDEEMCEESEENGQVTKEDETCLPLDSNNSEQSMETSDQMYGVSGDSSVPNNATVDEEMMDSYNSKQGCTGDSASNNDTSLGLENVASGKLEPEKKESKPEKIQSMPYNRLESEEKEAKRRDVDGPNEQQRTDNNGDTFEYCMDELEMEYQSALAPAEDNEVRHMEENDDEQTEVEFKKSKDNESNENNKIDNLEKGGPKKENADEALKDELVMMSEDEEAEEADLILNENEIGISKIGLYNECVETIEELRKNAMDDIEKKIGDSSAFVIDLEMAKRLWMNSERITFSLSSQLCESLKLILEPTLKSRLVGDYKTGKRLNMRKIIPFIASDYKKDKIWLRRTRPQKRKYQVMISIDNSKSMSESKSVQLAYESLALISNALNLLEVGEIAISSFGEEFKLLHPFGCSFSKESGPNVISQFSFMQTQTHVQEMMKNTISILDEARKRGDSNLMQLLLIISDGVCQDHNLIRRLVLEAAEKQILVIFIILDTKSSKNGLKGGSLLQTKNVTFVDGKMVIKEYMETFPFDYFVVLRDISGLPDILSEALRQWFEALSK